MNKNHNIKNRFSNKGWFYEAHFMQNFSNKKAPFKLDGANILSC